MLEVYINWLTVIIIEFISLQIDKLSEIGLKINLLIYNMKSDLGYWGNYDEENI